MQLDIPIKIVGLGRYLPERIVYNEELEARCGLAAGWIEERNGIRERRMAGPGETNSSMGAHAALEALGEANIPLSEVDLILNASGTNEQAIPDTAVFIQRALGLGRSGVACFSLHATCLSFVTALDTCASLIAAGRYRNILVVSSELTSVGINPREPESATLLGDGAAAALVTRAGADEASRMHNALLRSYGDGAYFTALNGGGSRLHPANADTRAEDNLFHMDGLAALRMVNHYVFDFLEELYPGLSRGACDLDAIVPHQASKLGLMLLNRFGWPESKVVRTLDWMGNCVAASIPATLYEGVRSGRIQRGDKVLLVGTGAGISIGGVILTY